MAGLFEDVGEVLLTTGAFPDVLVEVFDLQEEACGYGVGGVKVVGLACVGRVVGGTKGFEDFVPSLIMGGLGVLGELRWKVIHFSFLFFFW